MRLSTKFFIAFFSLSSVLAGAITFSLYQYMRKQLADDYVTRYSTLATTVSNTLKQLDATTDSILNNSLIAIDKHLQKNGVSDTASLKTLADQLGISDIGVTTADGFYIRSTGFDLSKLAERPNLFNYCADYRKLVTGETLAERTPLMPSALDDKVYKWSVRSMLNRKYVVSIGIRIEFLGKTLISALQADKNLRSVALLTPSGDVLGRFYNTGVKAEGDSARLDLAQAIAAPMRFTGDRLEILQKVAATVDRCCECVNKKLTAKAGDDTFFYYLHTDVSGRRCGLRKA